MNVIPPLTITNARLFDSTLAEPGPGENLYNSGSTYAEGDRVFLGSPSSTVTISNGSPAIVTWNSNGLPVGTRLSYATTGGLPTGVTVGETYYLRRRINANTFTFSTTPTGAEVATSSAGSGVHTATAEIHKLYESLQNANQNHYPAHPDSTEYWLDIGPTNRWAMFDILRNSQSFGPSPIQVTIRPGMRVDSIALLGIEADSLNIQVREAGTSPEIYSVTEELITRDTLTWYQYFFGPFTYKQAFVVFDLPPVSDIEIVVTLFRNTPGTCALGALVVGTYENIGEVQLNAEDDALNFSTVTRDEFGNATMVPRRTLPRTQQVLFVDKAKVRRIRALRELLNAVPAVWSGLDDETSDGYFESLLILGFYRQFKINLAHHVKAVINLELEEI